MICLLGKLEILFLELTDIEQRNGDVMNRTYNGLYTFQDIFVEFF